MKCQECDYCGIYTLCSEDNAKGMACSRCLKRVNGETTQPLLSSSTDDE